MLIKDEQFFLFNVGTFITEWDDGKIRSQRLLESEDSFRKVASKLVEITKYYKFDGWLINIENVIEVYITLIKLLFSYINEAVLANLGTILTDFFL